jgi:outer membrane protein, heavy metal efflux system
MAQKSSCGLLLACVLASAYPAAPQAAEKPPTSYALTLERALDLARTRAPSVRAARARIGAARGRLTSASVLLRDDPTFDLGGGPRVGPGGTSLDLDVGVGQVFELGGRRSARVEAAEAEVERSSAVANEAVRTALHDVAATFLRAKHAELRLQIATGTEHLAREIHSVARSRHEAGDVGLLDVNLAALTLERVEAELHTVEAARGRIMGELRVLLGLDADASVSLEGELLGRRRYDLDELLARAPERADLRALDAEIRQAEAQMRLAEAQGWPDLGVRLGYAREEEADIVLAGISLSLPIFDRGAGMADVARASEEAARIERRSAESAARTATRTAFAAYERLIEAVEHFEEKSIARIEQSETLARQAYAAGAMRLGELLAVRRELALTRVSHANLLLSAALAGVELEAEAGLLR